jgi:DNA primase
MVLCEMGIPSISFNAESVGVGDKVDYSDLIKMLKYRFYNVIVLYDNDDAGIVAARKLCAKYNLRSIILQKKKDISDLVFTYGKPKAFKQLKKRLSRVLRINTITPY